jgi:hypothetical protein
MLSAERSDIMMNWYIFIFLNSIGEEGKEGCIPVKDRSFHMSHAAKGKKENATKGDLTEP